MSERKIWAKLFDNKTKPEVSQSGDNFTETSPPDFPPIVEEENPWLRVSEMPSSQRANTGERKARETASAKSDRRRWMSEEALSPYGYVDNDGTLRQIESVNWRQVARKRKRFVPVTPRSGSVRIGDGGKSPAWTWQLVVSLGIVAFGYFAVSSPQPWVSKARHVYASAFLKDDSQVVTATVTHFLTNHHIAVATIAPSTPTTAPVTTTRLATRKRFHDPLAGTVIGDFSPQHPEVFIEGKSKEQVLAVASGTVARVASLGSGIFVSINHGQGLQSYYVGLGAVSVKTGEYVNAGEVIGRMPATFQPQLRFSIVQNGQYVNPHDYMTLPKAVAP